MTKRLQEKLGGRVLNQVLYLLQAGGETRRMIATALGMLCTKETPAPQELKTAMLERGALAALMEAVTDSDLFQTSQKEAALALYTVAEAAGTTDPIQVAAPLIAPAEPRSVFLGMEYVNNKKVSDVTFIVEGKEYYAHRVALLDSSEIFKSMFDGNGNFREAQGGPINIPNIRWEAFHAMMTCIYTGTVDVTPEMAQELLAASDQYMLDTLKRLCEATIAAQLTAENVSAAYDLAENFNAPELSKRCALFCLQHYEEVADVAREATKLPRNWAFGRLMQKMGGSLKEGVESDIVKRAEAMGEDGDNMVFG